MVSVICFWPYISTCYEIIFTSVNLLASSYEILLRKNNLLVWVIKCLVFIIFLTAQKKKKNLQFIVLFIL